MKTGASPTSTRKANHLARGALIAAAAEKCQTVCAEHVRIAATEVF